MDLNERWAEVKEYACPKRTYLDIDGKLPRDLCERIYETAQMLGLRVLWFRIDRTAHGYHVIIEWNRSFSPAEIVALQAILGSDPKRESLNLMRVFSGIETRQEKRCWNILFARKL